MGPQRVVIDTNVLISGFRWAGKPRQAVLLALEGAFEFIISEKQMGELRRVLAYEHLNIQPLEQKRILDIISAVSILVEPRTIVNVIKADPADNVLLETAEAGRANYIVTGDKHVLNQKEWKGAQIVSPASFLKQVEK